MQNNTQNNMKNNMQSNMQNLNLQNAEQNNAKQNVSFVNSQLQNAQTQLGQALTSVENPQNKQQIEKTLNKVNEAAQTANSTLSNYTESNKMQ